MSVTNRFYAEQNGASWCVRDREILIPIGPMRGQPHIVEWFSSQSQAENCVLELSATREHAADEAHSVSCGQQPAGGDPPMCASCHSLLACD
jgi:hypothetical protein